MTQLDAEFPEAPHSTTDSPSGAVPLFSNGQRKRPMLSNLGKESIAASQTISNPSPTTPTPLPIPSVPGSASSEVILQLKSQSASAYQSATASAAAEPSTDEPSLMAMLEHLATFQRHHDQKSRRIQQLEGNAKDLAKQLETARAELRQLAEDRIRSAETLGQQRQLLADLNTKLASYGRYEELIKDRFSELERVMQEIAGAKAKYQQAMKEMQTSLGEKDKHVAQVQRQKERLEDDLNLAKLANEDVRSRLSEARKEIEQLSADANQQIASLRLSHEAESQRLSQTASELKNVRAEKDAARKECAQALKELTELAMLEPFSGTCSTKDLGSLGNTVSWLKTTCLSLEELRAEASKSSQQALVKIGALEGQLQAQKEAIEKQNCAADGELRAKLKSLQFQLQAATDENVRLQSCLTSRDEDIGKVQAFLQSSGLHSPDKDLQKSIATAVSRFNELDTELKEARSAQKDAEHKHSLALKDKESDYANALKTEAARWKAQKDELESQIAALRAREKPAAVTMSTASEKTRRPIDPDLSAIIRDLREGAKALSPTKRHEHERPQSAKASKKRTKLAVSNKRSAEAALPLSGPMAVARHRSTRSSSIGASSSTNSPSSVHSSDIWSIFK